jgi:hypothetical protein
MNYCLEFAKANRLHMLDTVKDVFYNHTQCDFGEMISIHHNYAHYEKHFGEWYWIHRKGAISAKKGEFGIVPGSQGTPSYIVCGKGNADSFMSSAHGAGRVIGRREAIRKLDLNSIRKELDKSGIIHSIDKQKDLDLKEFIFGHLEDSYEWHITNIGDKRISIPLPVILHSKQTGWHLFLSSQFRKNNGTYKGFSIAPKGSNYEGKIIEYDASGIEIRPLDLSFTKTACSVFINIDDNIVNI